MCDPRGQIAVTRDLLGWKTKERTKDFDFESYVVVLTHKVDYER